MNTPTFARCYSKPLKPKIMVIFIEDNKSIFHKSDFQLYQLYFYPTFIAMSEKPRSLLAIPATPSVLSK